MREVLFACARLARRLLAMSGGADDGDGESEGVVPCGGCSGRGDCFNGTCFCEIRYSGDRCNGPNMPYRAGIGGVFLLVALICAVQLLTCIVTEYRKQKNPRIWRAFRVTTQKLLYFVVFLASLIRGAYFLSPSAFQDGWASSLLSAYYPLLISGSSLIVCFWAEVFHLRDAQRWERPQFLSKSFLAFVTFNFISYSLLAVEFVITQYADPSEERRDLYYHLFNGCYAVLLFIVVVFFLIYGVEVYFKIRGGFLAGASLAVNVTGAPAVRSPRKASLLGAKDDGDTDRLVAEGLLEHKKPVIVPVRSVPAEVPPVDTSQLHQSRLGLVSQALMLMFIVVFLASETLGEFWKNKVPVNSRNWHDVVFRLSEIGVALWFPCVLWNCMSPERLWILNPRRLLARQLDDKQLAAASKAGHEDAKPSEAESFLSGSVSGDCWICYDAERAEPLIRPCRCTGDVSSVHHDCLRRWLLECAANADGLKCKVCESPYQVEKTHKVEWELAVTGASLARGLASVVAMLGAGGGAWLAVTWWSSPVPRTLAAGAALLICYVCVRLLSQVSADAYRRATVSKLAIVAPTASSTGATTPTVETVSQSVDSVTVDVAQTCTKALLQTSPPPHDRD